MYHRVLFDDANESRLYDDDSAFIGYRDDDGDGGGGDDGLRCADGGNDLMCHHHRRRHHHFYLLLSYFWISYPMYGCFRVKYVCNGHCCCCGFS